MTSDKSSTPKDDKQPAPTPVAGTKVVTPPGGSPASAPTAARRASAPLWLLALMFLLAAGTAGLGYLVWLDYQRSALTQQQYYETQQRLEAQQLQLQQNRGEWQQGQQQQLAREQVWQQRVDSLEQRLQQQGELLRGLTSTTRADWQLAEAEFLLRVAQQRLMLDGSATAALALLESADAIVREQNNDDLFPVRDRLQRDITALKLVPEVDTTGYYLRLAALSDQIQALPVLPRMLADTDAADSGQQTAATTAEGVWGRIVQSFHAALTQLADQVRIRHHDEPLQPLLPPDGVEYLRQNLRFYMEQAQLALLRQETDVYQSSLASALQLVQRYFGGQEAGRKLAAELMQMQQLAITSELPNIRGSLQALQAYLERLHKLDERMGEPLQLPDSMPAAEADSAAEPQP
ncbi:uroporphyrinogen-III C-methyltransferase [Pseudomaricurvus sp. HS19]|uniref:uroporphyrinogen-III C-methyltransferase n=1 Tax=Pseudomaricurvus sp. HS19 TaxID=2692626 RepID=UPI00136A56F9|nr:uroporphyrinogen-III C-methyltransferase [Pseudomaricurvus sp. HS19]MYM63868.1 hypothetical protein [Pseudomaricurvus sp. HS19]